MSDSQRNLPVPPELERLSTFIDSHTECLAGSSGELRSIALCAAKHIFDWALETEEPSKSHLRTLLTMLTETAPPQTRSRARSTPMAKASPIHKPQKKIDVRETPLSYLLVEGMNTDQIWQQLDLRAARVCENLQVLQGDDEDENATLKEDGGNDGSEDEDRDDDEDEDEEETTEMDVDGDESPWEGLSGEEENDSSTAEGVVYLQEESSEDGDEDRRSPISMLDIVRGQRKLSPPRSHTRGYPDLDDDFFDLTAFNTETSELEAKELSKRKPHEDSAEESETDFFGSVDDTNATELLYNDFFEPPPGQMQNGSRRSSKVRFHERVSVKKIKAVGKGMPVSFMNDEDSEDDEDEDEWT